MSASELIHLDIKKLGRIGSVGHRITGRYPGAVNRHHASARSSTVSASTMLRSTSPGRKSSAVAFLQAAVTYFAKLGVRIERVMTDLAFTEWMVPPIAPIRSRWRRPGVGKIDGHREQRARSAFSDRITHLHGRMGPLSFLIALPGGSGWDKFWFAISTTV
jgi:hypothetical protein